MKSLSVLAGVVIGAAVMMTGCGSHSLDSVDASKYVTLGEYKGLTVSVNDTTVSEGAIEEAIKSDLESKAVLEPVTDRAVEDGDTVNIDYVGKKDGEAFEGGTANGADLVIGSNTYISGFESGLIGHNAGESVSLNLTFPKDYQSAELAGQDVVFDVTINSISQNVVPELTDELASQINSSVSTVEEYKEAVKSKLEETKQNTAKSMVYSDLLQLANENATIVSGNKLPKWLVKQNADNEKANFNANLSTYNITLEKYLSNFGMTEEQFNEEIQTFAENIASQQLLVEAIAQAENIKLSNDDIEKAYEDYAKRYSYTSTDDFKKKVKEKDGEAAFKESVLTTKVEEFLFKNANITNPEMVTWSVE